MSVLPSLLSGFHGWIDSVAATADKLLDRLRSKRDVHLIEEEADTFTLHAESPVGWFFRKAGEDPPQRSRSGEAVRRLVGALRLRTGFRLPNMPDCRVRIRDGSLEDALPPGWEALLRASRIVVTLQPDRFLFRPLELPTRALEFLDGIVRAQLDRLTPWAADAAVFGWTPPTGLPNDRIKLTVAASARALVEPYVHALMKRGATSVAVTTVSGDTGLPAVPVTVFEQRAQGMLGIDRIRHALIAGFVASGLAAAMATGYSAISADVLDATQQELSRKIAARRAALRAGPEFQTSAQLMLERRKQTTPSSVMVLEALSQILPDHTYVTELRIEGDKLQVVGITRDAPALILLIEQSVHFTHATFYSPTTRASDDPGERFHIEANIKPIFVPGT